MVVEGRRDGPDGKPKLMSVTERVTASCHVVTPVTLNHGAVTATESLRKQVYIFRKFVENPRCILMSQLPPSLVGAVFERAANSRPSKPSLAAPSSTGFPSVHHRSKSAFARARDLKRNGNQQSGDLRPTEPPIVKRSGSFASDESEIVGVVRNEQKSGRQSRGETQSKGAFGVY